MRRAQRLLVSLALVLLTIGVPLCAQSTLSGQLVIFNAGSLTAPLQALTKAFQVHYPNVTFAAEASGSNDAARKISELGREADIFLSADYAVIDQMLIPTYADWDIQFARNTMVLAYTDNSKYASEVNSDNWYSILTRDGVIYGHSDPNSDPAGYRALLVEQLAETIYNVPGLYADLVAHCPPENVRPKSMDLVALLQSGNMDYAWEYQSVAVQQNLRYVELPAAINLGDLTYARFYTTASVDITGSTPGTTTTMIGQPIVYGVTIPKNAPSPQLAIEFVKFLLGPEGQAIMQAQGQPAIVPATSAQKSLLPADLQGLVK